MIHEALLVGNNYIGTGFDLRSAENDVLNMEIYLHSQGFRVHKLINQLATKSTIISTWTDMASRCHPNDKSELVFFNSGHGTRIKETPAMTTWLRSQVPWYTASADGYGEAIVPADALPSWDGRKLLFDVELWQMFQRRPGGTRVTAILDCCYSGGITDKDKDRSHATMLARSIQSPDVVDFASLKLEGTDHAEYVHADEGNALASGLSPLRPPLHDTVLYSASTKNQLAYEAIQSFSSGQKWSGVLTRSLLQATRTPGSNTFLKIFSNLSAIARGIMPIQTPTFSAESLVALKPFLRY